jgi:hypothetical protein
MPDDRRTDHADHALLDSWLAAKAADGTLQKLLSGPASEQTIVLGEDSESLWRDLPARLSSAMVRESREHIPFPDFLKPRHIPMRLLNILPRAALDQDAQLVSAQTKHLVLAKNFLASYQVASKLSDGQLIAASALDGIASAKSFVTASDDERRTAIATHLPNIAFGLRQSAAHWPHDPVDGSLFRGDFVEQYFTGLTMQALLGQNRPGASRQTSAMPQPISVPVPIEAPPKPVQTPADRISNPQPPKNRQRRTGR